MGNSAICVLSTRKAFSMVFVVTTGVLSALHAHGLRHIADLEL
jgi:hypothetical protein